MTLLLHLHKFISKERNVWKEVDTEKKKKVECHRQGSNPGRNVESCVGGAKLILYTKLPFLASVVAKHSDLL